MYLSRTQILRRIAPLLLIGLAGSIAPHGDSPTTRPSAPVEHVQRIWSRPINGMRSRLLCNHTSVRAGQPVELTFRIENCSDHDVVVAAPLVRSVVQPIAFEGQSLDPNAGNLFVLAERLNDDRKEVKVLPESIDSQVFYPALPLAAGEQLWVTVNASPTKATTAPRGRIGAGLRRGAAGLMILTETTTFPGLNTAGKYRLTANFTVAGNEQNQPDLYGGQTRWNGTVESSPIELEVTPSDSQ